MDKFLIIKKGCVCMEKTEIEKRDLKPIFIYLGCSLILPLLLVVPFVLMKMNENLANTIVEFITFLVMGILLLKLYHKRIMGDLKEISLKKLLLVLLIGIVACIINEMLTPNITTDNQELIIKMVKTLPILSFFCICILGPFAEEMVFRYSFDTFIKNDILFIVVSSFIFGLIHTNGFSSGWWLYVLLGLLFSCVYIKTNHNIVLSTIIHVLLNIVDFIFIIL